MGKIITNDIFYGTKKLLKDGKTTKEAAEHMGISRDSVSKIRAVGTYAAYLRRWVYPKRKGGKSYESYKREAQRWHNYHKEPVNGREVELAKQKNIKAKAEAKPKVEAKKFVAESPKPAPEDQGLKFEVIRNDWKGLAVVAITVVIILLLTITIIEGIMIADLWRNIYGAV